MTDAKSEFYENALQKLIYQALDIANLADDAASSPIAEIAVALHTGAGPLDAGTQVTLEADYGGYTRIAVARTTAGWLVTLGVASPVANISFPEATSGTNTITFFSFGFTTSGAGNILHYGTVTPNIAVTAGVTPRLTTATTITES